MFWAQQISKWGLFPHSPMPLLRLFPQAEMPFPAFSLGGLPLKSQDAAWMFLLSESIFHAHSTHPTHLPQPASPECVHVPTSLSCSTEQVIMQSVFQPVSSH